MIFVLALSLVLSCCTASVDFTYSTIYDMCDFVGYHEVPLSECDSGCIIYASTVGNGSENRYAADSDERYDNLIVRDNINDRNFSITDLSRAYDEQTSQKTPLTITAPGSISVLNLNRLAEVYHPLVLYVVDKSKAAEFTYEVYDALNANGITVNPAAITTVMSAYPFLLTSKEADVANGVTARLAGFDNALDSNVDECPSVFSKPTTYPFGFNLNIVGPIISLSFAEQTAVQIDASIPPEQSFNLDLADDAFITSAGYNGCRKPHSGGIQNFRFVYFQEDSVYSLTSFAQEGSNVTFELDANYESGRTVKVINNDNSAETWTIRYSGKALFQIEKTTSVQVVLSRFYKVNQGFLLKWATETMEVPAPKLDPSLGASWARSPEDVLVTDSAPTPTIGGALLSSTIVFLVGRLF